MQRQLVNAWIFLKQGDDELHGVERYAYRSLLTYSRRNISRVRVSVVWKWNDTRFRLRSWSTTDCRRVVHFLESSYKKLNVTRELTWSLARMILFSLSWRGNPRDRELVSSLEIPGLNVDFLTYEIRIDSNWLISSWPLSKRASYKDRIEMHWLSGSRWSDYFWTSSLIMIGSSVLVNYIVSASLRIVTVHVKERRSYITYRHQAVQLSSTSSINSSW